MLVITEYQGTQSLQAVTSHEYKPEKSVLPDSRLISKSSCVWECRGWEAYSGRWAKSRQAMGSMRGPSGLDLVGVDPGSTLGIRCCQLQ